MCHTPKFPHFKPSDNIHNVIYTDIQFCKFQLNVDFVSAISNILDIIHYSTQLYHDIFHTVPISEASDIYQLKKSQTFMNISNKKCT